MCCSKSVIIQFVQFKKDSMWFILGFILLYSLLFLAVRKKFFFFLMQFWFCNICMLVNCTVYYGISFSSWERGMMLPWQVHVSICSVTGQMQPLVNWYCREAPLKANSRWHELYSGLCKYIVRYIFSHMLAALYMKRETYNCKHITCQTCLCLVPYFFVCVCRHGTCKEMSGDYELTSTPGRFFYHVASTYLSHWLSLCNLVVMQLPLQWSFIGPVLSLLQSGGQTWTPMWFTQTTLNMR